MKKFNVKVNGTSYEVEVEEIREGGGAAPAPKAAPAAAPAPKAAPAAAPAPKVAAGAGEHSIDAPMPGKIVKLVAAEGQAVKAGEVLLINEDAERNSRRCRRYG